MEALYDNLIPGLWIVWGIYWLIASRGAKPAVRLESVASRAGHVLPLVVAGLLLSIPFSGTFLAVRFWPASAVAFFLGTAIVLLGLLFTIWARLHLGRNWSGMVTVKDSHELVRAVRTAWCVTRSTLACSWGSWARRPPRAKSVACSPS